MNKNLTTVLESAKRVPLSLRESEALREIYLRRIDRAIADDGQKKIATVELMRILRSKK